MKNKFTDFFQPEDFSLAGVQSVNSMAAVYANNKLTKLIESCPVVYTKYYNQHEWSNRLPDKHDTHQARLICIEPLKVEECKHEPEQIIVEGWESFGKSTLQTVVLNQLLSKTRKCKHCDEPLTATWKSKGE